MNCCGDNPTYDFIMRLKFLRLVEYRFAILSAVLLNGFPSMFSNILYNLLSVIIEYGFIDILSIKKLSIMLKTSFRGVPQITFLSFCKNTKDSSTGIIVFAIFSIECPKNDLLIPVLNSIPIIVVSPWVTSIPIVLCGPIIVFPIEIVSLLDISMKSVIVLGISILLLTSISLYDDWFVMLKYTHIFVDGLISLIVVPLLYFIIQ